MRERIKICVIGASGFVGRVLVEKLIQNDSIEVVAVINSPGNSWPILRFDINIVQGNLSNKASIDAVLKNCTHVVNLALGSFDRMESDIENLIESCKLNKVKRLVHLSSVTVYGEYPDPKAEFEDGPVLAKKKSYGWFKMKQDQKLFEANHNGLSTIILCPPHVTGPYGRIFHQVVDAIKTNTFALVDNGKYPCNLIDVNNLCEAIVLSLHAENSDGKRIFVTNNDDFTWLDFAQCASKIANKNLDSIPRISAQEARDLKVGYLSFKELMIKIIKSNEVKTHLNNSVIRHNKMYYYILQQLVKVSKIFKKKATDIIVVQHKSTKTNNLNIWLCQQQLRGVRHSIKKAETSIGFQPKMNSYQSFELFEKYLTSLYAVNTEYSDLIEKLD